MRRNINDEDMGQSSSAPFFATLCFVLVCGFIALYYNANTIINQHKDMVFHKDNTISSLRDEVEHKTAEVEYIDKKFKALQKFKLPDRKQMDMLQQIQKCKAEVMTLKADIKRRDVEIRTYEAIQIKSNEYIKELLLKVNAKENKNG